MIVLLYFGYLDEEGIIEPLQCKDNYFLRIIL